MQMFTFTEGIKGAGNDIVGVDFQAVAFEEIDGGIVDHA